MYFEENLNELGHVVVSSSLRTSPNGPSEEVAERGIPLPGLARSSEKVAAVALWVAAIMVSV